MQYMTFWLLLTPFLGAFVGWILSKLTLQWLLNKQIPAQQQRAGTTIARAASSLISFDALAQKITDPANVQKIMPLAEEQIDHFLRVKLKQSMPVVGMFVGEKTIQQLKTVFMAELEALFPSIMKNYIQNMQQDLPLEQMIAEKIHSIPPKRIQNAIRSSFAGELQRIQWAGAAIGFSTGLIQVGIVYCLIIR